MRDVIRAVLMCLYVFAAFALVGCGSGDPPVASLSFSSADIEGGTLPIPKDGSSLVGVIAIGEDGDPVEVDASEFTWETSDGAIVEVQTLGTAALVTGLVDWFDTVPEGGDPATAHEPQATLTVIYHAGQSDEIRATIPVAVVINAAGHWRATVEGLGSQALALEQHGRNVSYVATTGEFGGRIDGSTFTLMQQGFTLTGTFMTRTEVTGTYVGPGDITGTWSATKD